MAVVGSRINRLKCWKDNDSDILQSLDELDREWVKLWRRVASKQFLLEKTATKPF
jgi:hypothetical protein